MTLSKVKVGMVAMVVAGLLVGGASPAASGTDAPSAKVAAGKKKKKKKCPAGTQKKVVKKKNGKKKTTCVALPPPPPLAAALSIAPGGIDFGSKPAQPMSGCAPFPTDDPDCPTQAFTVSNAGPGTSGIPAASIVDIATDLGGERAFSIVANTCTAPLAPGGSCTVTVRGAADNEFEYSSRLDVTATPGTTASATLAIN